MYIPQLIAAHCQCRHLDTFGPVLKKVILVCCPRNVRVPETCEMCCPRNAVPEMCPGMRLLSPKRETYARDALGFVGHH